MSKSTNKAQEWFSKIALAREWKKPYEKKWDEMIALLENKTLDSVEGDTICVNVVHPHVRVVVPAVYSRNPNVTVKPRVYNEDDEVIIKRADTASQLLRYYMEELNIKREAKLCLLDAVVTGLACVKTGYESEFDEEVSEGELPSSGKDTETFISKFLKKTGIKQEEEQEADKFYDNVNINYEAPWAERVSPYDLLFPGLIRRMERLPWIDHMIIMTLDDARDFYNNTKLPPSCDAGDLLKKMRGQSISSNIGSAEEYCIIHEIWDGKSRRVCSLSEGYDKYVDEKPSKFTMLNSKYHPFVFMRFNEIIDKFFPVGDIEPALPQIDELNATRTQQYTHRKRYNRRYYGRKGALDPSQQSILRDGEDGAYFEIAEEYDDRPLQDIITPVQDAPLPTEAYASEQRVKDDLVNILGTRDFASEGTRASSATEAQIMATQSRFRVEERIDIMGTFIEEIMTNILMIAMKFMDPIQVADVLGKDAVFWKRILKDEVIRKEFALDVDYSSSAPISKEIEKSQAMQFFQLFGNDPMMNAIKIRLDVVKAFEKSDPESYLNQQVAEEMQAQLLQKIKMGALMDGETSQDQSGSPPDVGRVPNPRPLGIDALRDRQASGGISRGRPRVPGGKGGTTAKVI